MSRTHWKAVLALTASLLTLLTATLFTPLALAQSGSWVVISSPNQGTEDNELNGVAAVSASDIWAVGSFYNPNTGQYGGLIEHWNGAAWSAVSSPSTTQLTGVTALASNNVWAVSDYAQILHWNGSIWSIVPSPQPCCGNYYQLNAVTALSANDIWAVGTRTVLVGEGDYSYYTVTEHWNGTTWTALNGADPGGGGCDYLYGVAALSTSDVWAVGYACGLSLVEHWTGTYWNLVSNPNPSAIQDSLQASTAIPATGDVWAVGYEDGSTGYQTLIEQCRAC